MFLITFYAHVICYFINYHGCAYYKVIYIQVPAADMSNMILGQQGMCIEYIFVDSAQIANRERPHP